MWELLDTHIQADKISQTIYSVLVAFSASHLTCFQEASAFKIGACLSGNKASPYHVTGVGHGHVQFEVLNDSVRAT